MRRPAFFVFSIALTALVCIALPIWIVEAIGSGSGMVSLNATGVAQTQDFNALATTGTSTTLPTGWYIDETGTNANGSYNTGTGSSNAGDTYSFGAASSAERALGGLRSGSLVPVLGAKFTNNTGTALTSLTITYTGEMWRAGVPNRGAADRLDFQMSTDATGLTTGTWTNQDNLDFNSPNTAAAVGTLNGNSAPNLANISYSITGLNIPVGSTFWIRWVDFDISSSDDGLAIDDFSITAYAIDQAPEVQSTYPVNGATDFPIGSNLSVTFSEPVNVISSWFSLACTVSGNVTAASSGGPTAFSIDPDVSLVSGETCTFTVLAGQVTDQDGNDPPDNMVANFVVGFSPLDVCLSAFTPIYQIQGSGLNAAITGNVVTKGVVVGDFDGPGGMEGFYIQDPNGDGNASTSDGIFVHTGNANLVSAGQLVRVAGFARERFNQTAISGANSNAVVVPAGNITVCGSGSVSPAEVTLPSATADSLERFEGMSVRFSQSLVISEYFEFDRFGEIELSLPLAGESRPFTPTSVEEPGAPAIARLLANQLHRITLDDGLSIQNPTSLRHPNGLAFSLDNRFRGGDSVSDVTGVLGYDFGVYRIQPTAAANHVALNQGPSVPEPVGGTLRLATMNTLNFFLTPDYPSSNPLDEQCGPSGDFECRGWDSDQPAEFTRQRNKLIAALVGLNADVVGLNELENTPGVDPLGDPVNGVVAGLNDALGAGTYSHVNTGVIGTDTIRVGFIYKPASVTLVGAPAVLNDPAFVNPFGVPTDRNRPAVAQTFLDNSTGNRFTAVANHFISKGASSCGAVNDPQTGDGQDNCNRTREVSAKVLLDWIASDPTGSGDPDFIIIGDLNSYAKEDPIDAIKAGPDDTAGTSDDYTNLIEHFQGRYSYSYVFDGQAGYLDHALASPSLFGQVTGTAVWHINADEPDIFDYDTSFKPQEQEALYEPDQYRSADHDPVVIGLQLNRAPTADAGGPYYVAEGSSVNLASTGADPEGGTLTYEWDLDGDGTFETAGQNVVFSAASLSAPATLTVKVRVTDPLGASATDEATVYVIYDFTGFFQPVNNLPTVNTVKAGQAIPLKFSLDGFQTLHIFETGYPMVEFTPCVAGPVDPVESTDTAGNSNLSYDTASDQYIYVWKTEKAWAGRCGTLLVKFNDGQTYIALFNFTK